MVVSRYLGAVWDPARETRNDLPILGAPITG
jgi:hypothetical protein